MVRTQKANSFLCSLLSIPMVRKKRNCLPQFIGTTSISEVMVWDPGVFVESNITVAKIVAIACNQLLHKDNTLKGLALVPTENKFFRTWVNYIKINQSQSKKSKKA